MRSMHWRAKPGGWARAVALCALMIGAGGTQAATGPMVRIDTGVIEGVARQNGQSAFFGIPYAAPPVGALRWQPPQLPASWTGVKSATGFGPNCAQPASPFGVASTSEDCLTLNVFTPETTFKSPRSTYPVMVWIHGGGLTTGESGDYDPAKLVDQGIVVVSINYRLGALGFLAAAPFAGSDNPGGNYGFLDQQAALRWVQSNIRRFGGNPDKVTIFGESAGGLSVLAHLVSPGSAGLFDRAIAQSGAYQLRQPTLAVAQTRAASTVTSLGCGGAPDVAACLRALPVATILASQGSNGLVVDGTVLPRSFEAAFTTGDFNKVPVMNGANLDESTLFVATNFLLVGQSVTAANYTGLLAGVFGSAAALVAAQYPLSDYPTPPQALAAILTDQTFSCNARVATRWLSDYVRVFAYEFRDRTTPQILLPQIPGLAYGAYHASEVQYLLGGFRAPPFPQALNSAQARLSDSMIRYWARFARTGSPNPPQTPAWRQYDARRDQFQSLDLGAVGPVAGYAAFHKCAFWDGLQGYVSP